MAASLKAEDSPRSDFVVTLSPNVFTNQGTSDADDTGDDDDTTARAPAAIRFDDAADAINTAANLIGASALAGVAQDDTLRFAVTSLSFIDEQTKITSDLLSQSVAQESTLTSVLTSLEGIRLATEQTAQLPLVEQLRDAGVAFPRTLEDRTDSPIPDVLNQSGINLFAGFDNIDRNLQTLLDAQSQAQGTPDLSVMGTPDNPIYIRDVDAGAPRKVEIVGGNVDAKVVNKTLDTNVVNTVGVKQVGTFAVTQGGEFVVQLAGGGTIPVRVEGGRMVVDIAGGLEGLAVQLADTEVGLRAVGAI